MKIGIVKYTQVMNCGHTRPFVWLQHKIRFVVEKITHFPVSTPGLKIFQGRGHRPVEDRCIIVNPIQDLPQGIPQQQKADNIFCARVVYAVYPR
jgi:hypothetical protein